VAKTKTNRKLSFFVNPLFSPNSIYNTSKTHREMIVFPPIPRSTTPQNCRDGTPAVQNWSQAAFLWAPKSFLPSRNSATNVEVRTKVNLRLVPDKIIKEKQHLDPPQPSGLSSRCSGSTVFIFPQNTKKLKKRSPHDSIRTPSGAQIGQKNLFRHLQKTVASVKQTTDAHNLLPKA